MGELVDVLKTAGLRMLPFIKAVTLYFILVKTDRIGEAWTTILKCAPILCLMLFILLLGFNFNNKKKYRQLILMGLIFSCFGDALLNLDLFPHGMGSFAIAQIFYTIAFGFKPIKPVIAFILYSLAITFVSITFKHLDEILVIGLPIYAFLLSTMCWRSVARAVDTKHFVYIICAIGSILFVISDGIIAVDKFLIKVPNARYYIMATYYAAQFAITLSVVKDNNDKNNKSNNNVQKNKNKKKSK